MAAISVVIVCKNEAGIIGTTLQSLAGLTDDIIVYDNGSTDDTISILKKFPVQLHEGAWEGYGLTKNKAIGLARYDWILSLDADEAIDETLKQSLLAFDLSDEQSVADIRFRNFLGNRPVKHGEWGSEHHIRLFNRKKVQWDQELVHERLMFPSSVAVKKLKGYVLHRTIRDMEDYTQKMKHYAMLNAMKYQKHGKKASWVKLYCSPGFTFFHYYILKAGFLDGYAGYVCAKMTAWYTFLKYARLKELNSAIEQRPFF